VICANSARSTSGDAMPLQHYCEHGRRVPPSDAHSNSGRNPGIDHRGTTRGTWTRRGCRSTSSIGHARVEHIRPRDHRRWNYRRWCGTRSVARGLRVALSSVMISPVARSSRSSRLVHGGVRYLEHGHFALVFESSRERRLLLQLAPHLVRPLAFTWPCIAARAWRCGRCARASCCMT
jgi:hypothetical protein